MSTSIHQGLNPYLAIGLQSNPFIGEEQLDNAQIFWVDRGYSQAPPRQAKRLVQVLGRKGVGKTAHLKHWQSQTGGPYYYYPSGWKRFKVPGVGKIAYWDEANRIPIPYLLIAFAWATFTRATIVMGTHEDRGCIAKRFGFTIQTIHLPELDAESLMLWANHRIKTVGLSNQTCHLTLAPEKAEEIIATAQGSWRSAADHLHIWAADVANHFDAG